jgi:hypothetical protein
MRVMPLGRHRATIVRWRTAIRHELVRGGPCRPRLGRTGDHRAAAGAPRAPDGSYFHDGDRAAGVFGVLATGFAVLLGLVVVLAFTSYDDSRAGAETEAITVAQQYEVAHLLPETGGRRLASELICYGRSVVHEEWPRMVDGTQADAMNPWGVALFRTLRAIEPRTASQEAAYSKWLDQRLDRVAGVVAQRGERGRIRETIGIALSFARVRGRGAGTKHRRRRGAGALRRTRAAPLLI